MHKLLLSVSIAIALPASAGEKQTGIAPGIYSNEEQVYFDKEAKRAAPPWLSISVTRAGRAVKAEAIDAFGKPVAGAIDSAALTSSAIPGRLDYRFPGGQTTELRLARAITCWVAVRKDKAKADGSEDWYFQRGVKLHDQGGRAQVGGEQTGAQPVIVRLRNVTWDVGSTNHPVLTLYMHKPENPDHAESYSWAAPDSERIGINLRWVQSGCSVDTPKASAIPPSATTKG